MSFNWADPRRNSSVSVKMMEKAEAARKQRLHRIKSAVSTHLDPAVEKKLPKKLQHDKQISPTDAYLDTLRISDSFYDSLVKFHNNQEAPSPPSNAPFSVHNVVATDSLFHPESEIEAFKSLKKDTPPPASREKLKMHEPPPSRNSTKGRTRDKLPLLKTTVSKRDVHMTSTRSDPDLSLYGDPRRRDCDALDLLNPSRSDSAPSVLATTRSEHDLASEEKNDSRTSRVVPKLNLNSLSSDKKATVKVVAEETKVSAKAAPAEDATESSKKSKTKKESSRSKHGTSLADLRDEHKAALELLQELGGAYPEEDDKQQSRFRSKLRSTIREGRQSNNETSLVEAALLAADHALQATPEEVPEAQSPEKSQPSSRRSEGSPSYGSEDFETD
ncbi:unnamed protein product [Aphanomyces euteiches]|uniref:Uncharacterized protein n=1 Tax=Aphanomyces euteiches TaxID=100861 RepID=A0A6G0WWE2_9STRA|nr:hypothetical protein Ae201684_010967 [Aphanomyces euteiches]KAH9058602.1 hypothetical protein Ae201684P_005945 [Aphanomyces euteiches]KAH9139817.1 hypothetical protein AeRB84_015923 [Aphanomyces euteiches]